MHRFIFIILFFVVSNAEGYDFSKLDSIIQSGITNRFYPGAQVLIGDKNKIVYEKCYGKFTYEENSPEVKNDNIFDLASVTKVIATTTIQNLLLHNSGLKAWIPFYKSCKTKEEALKIIFNVTLEYKTNTRFVYSDLNAILLG